MMSRKFIDGVRKRLRSKRRGTPADRSRNGNAMKCLACGREIGFLRQLRDTEFCSHSCRRRGERPSAMALRDAEERTPSRSHADLDELQRRRAKARPPIGIILVMVGMLVVLITLGGRDSGAPAPTGTPDEGVVLSDPGDGFFSRMWTHITEKPVVRLREDFRSGFDSWVTEGGTPLNLSRKHHALETGDLVLWKPSLKFVDYRFEFEGQIEHKAMTWVFRSPNINSYYSTKLQATSDGNPHQATILRSVVIGTKTVDQVELPIPLRILPDHQYLVSVEAYGSKFVTSVDGHVIDTWDDIRLHYGGVGFCASRGESASIQWARIVQSESRFGKLFAGFLIAPSESGVIPLF